MDTLTSAAELHEQLVAWRRDFHMHPELGLEERRSAGIIAEILRGLGYRVQEGVAKTGVVGVLENGPGPVVMSRVDMDALPIQEANDVPYVSQHPGRMHACGHDAHMAIGLGVATLMAQHRDAWRGTLKLIFQPGEEGANGADIMVKEGVLENPRPDVALAVHVWNKNPVGTFGATAGPVMAGAESWEATITGKGGHGAMPEQTVDPIVTAALTVNALQTVVSRNVSALDTAVVTVGALLSGDAFNVIPDSALLRGTIRTYNLQTRDMVIRRVREIIEGTARMMGAEATVGLYPLTPPLVNDPRVTALVRDVVADLFGTDALKDDVRTMGSEDAAFFLQEIPGCFIFVGSGFTDREAPAHHNAHFDIDERALVNGVAVVVEALCRLMPKGSKE
ncbi:MAG TPA: M20 family metallopeptidase [Anaerolineae bacterium]|nr:M20 family metallopeptidase [Anaerolineae bacterium]